MSSPIFDQLNENITAITENAYKRGHLDARITILKQLQGMSVEMIDPARLMTQIIEMLGDVKTPAKAPKSRKKVA